MRQSSGLRSHISRLPLANDAHCELLMKQIDGRMAVAQPERL
jgi:hypothetical protein